MLGRKSYTREEFETGKAAVDQQLATYRKLASAVSGHGSANATQSALGDFETLFFNNMVLVLDRYYVHRLRTVTGKDGNALNEVELITDSLMNNDGVMRGNNVIKYVAKDSVTKLEVGDQIQLTDKAV
jgi:hypothetical protein